MAINSLRNDCDLITTEKRTKQDHIEYGHNPNLNLYCICMI